MACCNNGCTNAQAELAIAAVSDVDCFKLIKEYDWVKLKSEQTMPIAIPAEDIPAVNKAIHEGHVVIVTNRVPANEAQAFAALVERKGDYCACVQIRLLLSMHITVLDDTTGDILSQFDRTNQMFDSASLCFPKDMPESAIKLRVQEAEASNLNTSPDDGFLTFLVSACTDIQVELEIKAKIKIEGLCPSREGKPCRGSVGCTFGTPTYPAQCPNTCS